MKGMLSCTALFDIVQKSFSRIKGPALREGIIRLQDCLLSGYALFSLKFASLLQFDQHFREEIIRENLKQVFQINKVPSDTQMRERLDEIDAQELRRPFKRLLAQCQQSNYLNIMREDIGYPWMVQAIFILTKSIVVVLPKAT